MHIFSLQKIETPRIILRPLQIGDELALYECINRSLTSLQQWMPWAKNSSLATTQNFVHSQVAKWKSKTGNNFPMVVIHKPNQKIIGSSGFNEDTIITKGIYTIGYWLDISFHGQGLATEFVNGLTRYAFESLQAQAVHIRIQKANIKSIAVATRLGFTSTTINFQEETKNTISGQATTDSILLFTRVNTSLLPHLDVVWHMSESICKDSTDGLT